MTVFQAWTALLALFAFALHPAAAEPSVLRIAGGFGIHYLPFYVMEADGLVEKHAKAMGLPDLKATYAKISGDGALNTALLSGSVDVVGAGTGPFAIIWDKTRGKLNVKALTAMGDVPLVLLTNDPRIKTLADIGKDDRIALPAVRASMQATLLQMATAKLKGDAQYNALDQNTVTLPHEDALTAIVARSGVVDLHFSVEPYVSRELRTPGVHVVTDTEAIMGGPVSLNLTFTTERFHDANPLAIRIFVAALADAMQVIKQDPAHAAAIYLQADKAAGADEKTIEAILRNPAIDFTIDPHGVGRFTQFMYKTGVIQNDPGNWRNLFFDQAKGLDGN